MSVKQIQFETSHTSPARSAKTTMFCHRQQLRRWATRVLLVWLFGLGIGVANACLAASIFEVARHSIAGSAASAPEHEGTAAEDRSHYAGVTQSVSDEAAADQRGVADKSSCQNFCDRASVSVPPQKSFVDDAHVPALPPPVAATVVPVPAFPPVRVWVARRDAALAPPIPIAFLRLAL